MVIAWQSSLDEAKKQAQGEKKLLFIDFSLAPA